MTIREKDLRKLHTQLAISAKNEYTKRGPTDVPPLLVVQFDDGCVYVGMLVDVEDGLNPGMVAALSTKALWIEHRGELSSVTLILEGYAKLYADEEELAIHQSGDYARQYADDPDSGVTEIISTSYFEWENDHLACSIVTHPFHYDDGGKLVWGEPIVGIDQEAGGRVVESFRWFWERGDG
jgi:hypothetical protein